LDRHTFLAGRKFLEALHEPRHLKPDLSQDPAAVLGPFIVATGLVEPFERVELQNCPGYSSAFRE
jgi:hypothetical protein